MPATPSRWLPAACRPVREAAVGGGLALYIEIRSREQSRGKKKKDTCRLCQNVDVITVCPQLLVLTQLSLKGAQRGVQREGEQGRHQRVALLAPLRLGNTVRAIAGLPHRTGLACIPQSAERESCRCSRDTAQGRKHGFAADKVICCGNISGKDREVGVSLRTCLQSMGQCFATSTSGESILMRMASRLDIVRTLLCRCARNKPAQEVTGGFANGNQQRAQGRWPANVAPQLPIDVRTACLRLPCACQRRHEGGMAAQGPACGRGSVAWLHKQACQVAAAPRAPRQGPWCAQAIAAGPLALWPDRLASDGPQRPEAMGTLVACTLAQQFGEQFGEQFRQARAIPVRTQHARRLRSVDPCIGGRNGSGPSNNVAEHIWRGRAWPHLPRQYAAGSELPRPAGRPAALRTPVLWAAQPLYML